MSAGEVIAQSIDERGYAFDVQDMEQQFFEVLGSQLSAAGLCPELLCMARMGDGGFNVYYGAGLYVGKLCLRTLPDKWAAVKPGAKRASKVFDNEGDALAYITAKPGLTIDHRRGGTLTFMQYLKGLQTVKDLYDPTLEDCMAAIRHWITYIQKHKL